MDLGTMTKKLAEGQYLSAKEFQQDLNCIWQNCYTYNTDPVPFILNFLFADKYLELTAH